VKESRRQASSVFLIALLLSAALHAAVGFGVIFCRKGLLSPSSPAGTKSRARILEIGLVDTGILTKSPKAAAGETDLSEEQFLSAPSAVSMVRESDEPEPEGAPLRLSAPPVPPGRAGQAERTSSPETDSYLDEVRRKIETAVRYPRRARLRRLEGKVKVGFSVSAEGNLERPRVIDPSPHPVLNRESLSVLDRAAPFPPPRPALLGKEIAVFIEFKSNY